MEMRKLGRTGLKVAALCLGGNTFGWTTDQKASEAVLDAYMEAGGNFIDTADIYSIWAPGNKGGESETALGTWMAARKNRRAVVMATKVMGPMGSGPNDSGLSRQHIMEGVEASLRRLQTDYLDLYQAHWDDRDTPLDETLRAFDDLVRQGKVRYIGASNYVAWRLTRALWESDKRGYARFESIQPKYNLVFRDEYERELEPLCLEQNIAVIPYSSLASGFLSGKYRAGAAVSIGPGVQCRDVVVFLPAPRGVLTRCLRTYSKREWARIYTVPPKGHRRLTTRPTDRLSTSKPTKQRGRTRSGEARSCP